MYGTSQQFRNLLHANLSIEVYRVKNATVKLGIGHREGTIFVNDDTKDVYVTKINTYPYHTLTSLLAGNYLISLNTGGVGDMLKSVYDIDDSGVVDASEALTTSSGTVTGDALLLLIAAAGNTRAGVEALTMDTPKAVTFETPFANPAYSLVVNCIDSSGYMVGYIITNKTINGFTIEASADCSYNYLAAPYTPAP